MIDELQELKCKTKLKFCKNLSNYYNEMRKRNFQTQEDPFNKNSQGINKIYHEILLLMKILQTKPQVKIMNINYFDLYYIVIRIRDENRDIDNQYENDENDYINFNDNVANHYIGFKPRETLLRREKIEILDKSFQVNF